MTLNNAEWLFRVKFVFEQVRLASDRATFENNCMKPNKDRHILQAAQIFSRDSSVWHYKVPANIRAGLLEKRRQTTVGLRVNVRLDLIYRPRSG